MYVASQADRVHGFLAPSPLEVSRRRQAYSWISAGPRSAGTAALRIREASGEYRVIYLANLVDAIYVLHAFQKEISQDIQPGCGPGSSEIRGTVEEAAMTRQNRFASVWDAIENPREAANLRARADVAHVLVNEIERRTLTQARAATLLGVTQPRISDLMRGRLDLFSLDTLVEMAGRAGFQVGIRLSRRRVA